MNVQEQIKEYINSQPEPKRNDMQELHGSHFRCYRIVNYGSTTVKTAKVKLFVILP